jgi:hypothetical protein
LIIKIRSLLNIHYFRIDIQEKSCLETLFQGVILIFHPMASKQWHDALVYHGTKPQESANSDGFEKILSFAPEKQSEKAAAKVVNPP